MNAPSRYPLFAFFMTVLVAGPALAVERPGESPPLEPIIAALGVNVEHSAELSPEARRVAHAAGDRLVSLCPHCRLSTISEEGPCGWARSNRRIIQAAVARGWNEDAIVEAYVKTYGTRVLSVPKDSGLAAASWFVPYAAGITGLTITMLLGFRMRSKLPPSERQEPSAVASDTLARELAELD